MATLDECRSAIDLVSQRINQIDETKRRAHIVERTISLTISDLQSVFDMRLTSQGLVDVTSRSSAAPGPPAQVRITTSSDDLVALAEDRLDYTKALFTGRVKVKASFSDMARLRKLL